MAAATILVCDDEAPLRALVRAALEEDGYDIVEARDGEEALAAARTVRPDLILLDAMMPGRSGFEVLRELRAHPTLASTRIVMLTARVQESDRDAASAGGADRFLAKPFSPLELARLVGELLEGP